MPKTISQLEFVREWFQANQGRFIHHSESKPALEAGWLALTGRRFEDPDRAIRRLHQDNQLIQKDDERGVYAWNTSYEPDSNEKFSDFLKENIRARDEYRCHECENPKDGDKLFVEFKIDPENGGRAQASNGITLCGLHALSLRLSRQKPLGKALLAKLTNDLYSAKADPQKTRNTWQKVLVAIADDAGSLKAFETFLS